MLRYTLATVVVLQLYVYSPTLGNCVSGSDRDIRCSNETLQHPFIKNQVRDPSTLWKITIVSCELAEIVDTDFEGCTSLTHLYIIDVKLTDISEFALGELRKLLVLVIKNAGLKRIPPRLFANNTVMKSIRLTGNNIEFISPGTFPVNLTELDLSDNSIKTLDFQAYSSENLILLLLGNPIEKIVNTSFASVKEIHIDRHVDLYYKSDLDYLNNEVHEHYRCTNQYDLVTYLRKRSAFQGTYEREHLHVDESFSFQCLKVCSEEVGKVCDVPCSSVCEQELGSSVSITEVDTGEIRTSERPSNLEEREATPEFKDENVLETTTKHVSVLHEQDLESNNNVTKLNNQPTECSCLVYIFICVFLIFILLLSLIWQIYIGVSRKNFYIRDGEQQAAAALPLTVNTP